MKTKRLLFQFVLFLFVLIQTEQIHAQDVHKTAPNVYNLLADTLRIRIFEINFGPGESAAMHRHPDHAVYTLSSGKLEITNDKGVKEIIEFPAGLGFVFPSESHSAKNIGPSSARAIVVEVDRPRK